MGKGVEIQPILPGIDDELMGPDIRKILIDFDFEDCRPETRKQLFEFCNHEKLPILIISHNRTRDTSLIVPHDRPIVMEEIVDTLNEIGIKVLDTNF